MTKTCSACGGTEFLRTSPFHGEHPICKPCFMVWYEGGVLDGRQIDQSKAAQVGALSLHLKSLGKFPWTGEFAPKVQG
jgi:hypothetical protein